MPVEPDAALLHELTVLAAAATGFRTDAVEPAAVRRAALLELERGASAADLLERARRRDPGLVERLVHAVCVGETYFFRQPAQLELIRDIVLPRHRSSGAQGFRAWSAGCATGEEAYTLAALLLSEGRGRLGPVSVLGTDLLASNVETARAGVYGRRSVRAPVSGAPWPAFRSTAAGFEVLPEVRAITAFEARNLLDPPPPGGFDLIVCRNVLIYFATAAAEVARAHLVTALKPGGAVLFGTLDASEPPAGLSRLGFTDRPLFVKEAGRVAAETSNNRRMSDIRNHVNTGCSVNSEIPKFRDNVVGADIASTSGEIRDQSPASRSEDPAALHLQALHSIDEGDEARASALLGALCRAAPDYVPGLLERALLLSRGGAVDEALDLMRAILRTTGGFPKEMVLAAPEPLPVTFYRASAQAFLERHGAHA